MTGKFDCYEFEYIVSGTFSIDFITSTVRVHGPIHTVSGTEIFFHNKISGKILMK
jgi:hypothetical protein